MSAMAFRGIGALLDTRTHLTEDNEKWRSLALFFARFEADLDAAVLRPTLDEYGASREPFRAGFDPGGDADFSLSWTRLGLPGQSGVLASVQRVAYRLRGHKVEQLVWTAPDQAPRSVPAVNPVLDHVATLDLRYLDLGTAGYSWQDRWASPAQKNLPRAVEMSLVMDSGERFVRTFAVAVSPP